MTIGGGKKILEYIDLSKRIYLNVGSGDDQTANYLFENNPDAVVYDIDHIKSHDFERRNYHFVKYDLNNGLPAILPQADIIICNHVLEHIANPGIFLKGIYSTLKRNGTFYISVPPLKHEIVSGHIHIYNMGLLIYNLALSGFDIVNGRFATIGYNMIGIVNKGTIKIPKLKGDYPDMNTLVESGILPKEMKHGFNGNINQYNW